jgi:hypothetical protein
MKGGRDIPASATGTAQTGTYSWQATYSGDSGNNPATSPCVEMDVTAPPPPNLVPNPGFENACGIAPCHWSEESTVSTVVAQDGASPHSGSADMAVAGGFDGSSTTAFALSDCFAISPSTTYTSRAGTG